MLSIEKFECNMFQENCYIVSDESKECIIIDYTLTQQNGPRYFMLNKPQGYVCSTDDPDHPTILYFLDEPVAHKLHAAGRLDIDTTR